ncbi:MAG: gephyrin-like molybdotransferase Glp [bacterium]
MNTVSFREANDLMLEAAVPLPGEDIDLVSALGRVLAQDVVSDVDMPPFDKSAMDGYACRRADLAASLTVVEEIPAGRMPGLPVGPRQCARIMTGAPVPDGADCVVMVEQTETLPDGRIRMTNIKTADNICRKAEDIHSGECVLGQGEIITPAQMAVLASVGCVRPRVACRPRVTVLVTGNELVEPDGLPVGARIRNSNGTQLCAHLQQMGVVPQYGGIVEDTRDAIDQAVKKAMPKSDLILLSGGVSAGVYDLVPESLRQNGFEFLFERVDMQPGRPTLFGRCGSLYCCGLPGNPVATFVVFELLLKPFLYRLMGHDSLPHLVEAVLFRDVSCKAGRKQVTIPVRFTQSGVVEPLEYHGSAHINAMTRAQALLTFPMGQDTLRAGATVYVRPI